MLTKYLIAACVALALLTAGSVTLAYRMSVKAGQAQAEVSRLTDEAQEAAKALKRSQALSARLARDKASTARQEAALRLQLREALDKNPEWRDAPVPKEVQDALAQ